MLGSEASLEDDTRLTQRPGAPCLLSPITEGVGCGTIQTTADDPDRNEEIVL